MVFEVISEKKHGFDDVRDAVMGAATGFLGISGAAKSKPRLLADRWDMNRQRGILVAERKGMGKVIGALCLLNRIAESPAMIRSLGVSGILKKAIKKHY